MRATVLEVNTNEFKRNIELIKKYTKKEVLPVIKANGYGTHINENLNIINMFDIVGVAIIDEAIKLSEVEDLYAPYKEKRKTKGTEAIKLGLEPLAKIIMSLPNKTREEVARSYLTDQVKTVSDAITNAGYIIADWISDRPKYRKYIRNYYFYNGTVKGKIKKNAEDPNKTYEIYYDFTEKIKYATCLSGKTI